MVLVLSDDLGIILSNFIDMVRKDHPRIESWHAYFCFFNLIAEKYYIILAEKNQSLFSLLPEKHI